MVKQYWNMRIHFREIFIYMILLMEPMSGKVRHWSPDDNFENVRSLRFIEELSLSNVGNNYLVVNENDAVICFLKFNAVSCSLTEKRAKIAADFMKKFKNIERLDLNFSEGSILQINEDAFHDLNNLKELTLSNIFIKQNYFKDLNALKVAYFIECRFEGTISNRYIFNNLYNLEQMWATLCNMTTIHKELFRNMSNLSALVLPENQIETIEAGALDYLTDLSLINFSKNKILNIKNIFKNLTKLSALILSKNNISNVTWDEFQGMASLEYLDLVDNKIVFFDPQKISKYLPNLRFLKIYGNSASNNQMEKFASKLKQNLNSCVVRYTSPYK